MSRTEKQPTNERLRDPNGCPGSRSLTTREGVLSPFLSEGTQGFTQWRLGGGTQAPIQ